MIADFSATAYECSSADIHDIVAAGRLVDTSEQNTFTYESETLNIKDMIQSEGKYILTLDED